MVAAVTFQPRAAITCPPTLGCASRRSESSKIIYICKDHKHLNTINVNADVEGKRESRWHILQSARENSSNIDLYYEDHGRVKPVVLIHGYPLSGRLVGKAGAGSFGCRKSRYHLRPQRIWQIQPADDRYNYDTFAEDLHKICGRNSNCAISRWWVSRWAAAKWPLLR